MKLGFGQNTVQLAMGFPSYRIRLLPSRPPRTIIAAFISCAFARPVRWTNGINDTPWLHQLRVPR